MSESRTPVKRLDSLLAGLEDEVLTSEAEKDVSAERLATMRSEVEALIVASVDRAEEREPGRGAGAPTVGARVKVARAMERLGSWTGAIAPGGRAGGVAAGADGVLGGPAREGKEEQGRRCRAGGLRAGG